MRRAAWRSLIAVGIASFGLFALLPFVHASEPGHHEENCPAAPVLLAGAVVLPALPVLEPGFSSVAPAPMRAETLVETRFPSVHSPRGPPV